MNAEVEVEGTFDPQRFFNTLALILSRRENVKITVRVVEKKSNDHKVAV